MNEEQKAEPTMKRRSRFVVAGTGSGSGKTTVTLGLMRAFAQRGLKVQGFKCGPDYIDPTYHAAVTGCPSHNLDSWMTSSDYLVDHFLQASESADLSIIEGVMGLYDGKDPLGLSGSTAEIALLTASPVLLVVDVRSMGRSAAAIVLGFQQLEPRVRIAAVIVNRCGSTSHYETVKLAIEEACGIPVIGWLLRDNSLSIPERHLGLLPAIERGELEPLFNHAAARIAEGTNLDRLLGIAQVATPLQSPSIELGLPAGLNAVRHSSRIDQPSGLNFSEALSVPTHNSPVIAVARDAAFNFYYTDNLELLVRAGARLIEFSPLRGEGVPKEADGLYLGGGFPEEFASVISHNFAFMEDLRAAADNGMPLYAECGGYMVLARSLTDRAGRQHEMAGIIPAHTVMLERRAALGYREVTAREDNLLLKQGEGLRGHEFHYSVMNYDDVQHFYAYDSKGRGGSQPEGYVRGNIMAAYAHIHLASNLSAAFRLVEACRLYREQRLQ